MLSDVLMSKWKVHQDENDYWNSNSFKYVNVEDIAERFGAISMNEKYIHENLLILNVLIIVISSKRVTEFVPDRVFMGRGRGLHESHHNYKAPGEVEKRKKLKLPNVIC